MKSPLALIFPALLAVLMMQTLWSAEVDGTYRLSGMTGFLRVEGRDYRYNYSYIGGYYYDSDFNEWHSYPFPPEGILAAVLGRGVVVRDQRIRVNLAEARAEIVRVALKDPRLSNLVYFNIHTLPDFPRFRRLANGTFYAQTRQPLTIEVGVQAGDGITRASAWADYRARIIGNKLLLRVTFRGRGGPLGEDRKTYNLEGTARITAILK